MMPFPETSRLYSSEDDNGGLSAFFVYILYVWNLSLLFLLKGFSNILPSLVQNHSVLWKQRNLMVSSTSYFSTSNPVTSVAYTF